MEITINPLYDKFGSIISATGKVDIRELDKIKVINLFNCSGVVLFRGFDLNTDKFKKLTELFSTNFMSFLGGRYSRKMINGDKTFLSVRESMIKEDNLATPLEDNGDNLAIPLHGEMYYKKKKPTLIWFYCANPALKDGETIVCDGVKLYNNLNPSTQNLFEEKRIKYISKFCEEKWQQIYGTNDLNIVKQICEEDNIQLRINPDKSLTLEYVCSAIVKSRCGQHKVFMNSVLPVVKQEELLGEIKASNVKFEDCTKIPEAVIKEVQEVAAKLTYPIKWQKHDVLMVDNTRVLHGRKAFSDNQRDIYIRLCEPNFQVQGLEDV